MKMTGAIIMNHDVDEIMIAAGAASTTSVLVC
jgi:hypothetical protein